VRVLTVSGWKTVPAQEIRKRFALGSTDFEVRVMSLDPPNSLAVFGDHIQVHGWVRAPASPAKVALTSAEHSSERRLAADLARVPGAGDKHEGGTLVRSGRSLC
jgi:hypothetical protein